MKILIYNWRDIKNQVAGGREVFTHENGKRRVLSGHPVDLFCVQPSKAAKSNKPGAM